MAGSIKWFVYTDDSDNQYALKLDESNTEAINGADGDYTPTSSTQVGLPRNLKPREAFYSNAARTRTIRCIPLSSGAYVGLVNGNIATIPDPIQPGEPALSLVRLNGERRTIPFAADSGLTDGDDD
jgi:hypothetical protein